MTDDERRDVARRLRELRLDPWDDAACEIALCVGIACCNSECHGSNETPECTMALASRLADLIEPTRNCGECDRDALLALADEMFEDATGLALISQLENNEELQDLQSTMAKALMDYARRIREACGEVKS